MYVYVYMYIYMYVYMYMCIYVYMYTRYWARQGGLIRKMNMGTKDISKNMHVETVLDADDSPRM